MKNVTLTICVLIFLMLIVPGHALVIKRGNAVVIALDESIDDDLLVFCQSLEINGKVTGDVYAFAQNVTINGDVGGTIFAGAATITISAQTAKTIWAAGANVKITGEVENNVIFAGGQLAIGENSSVGKDVRAYGGNFTVEGIVYGTVKGGVGSFTMAGESGPIKISADEAKIKSGARIVGDLIVRSEKEPTIEEGATITGETRLEKPRPKDRAAAFAFAPLIALLISLVKIVMYIAKIVVGIILIACSKTFVRRIMDTLLRKPWHSLGWGFLGLIVIPVVAVILFVILIGYPIAIFAVYSYTVLIYLSSIFVGLVIGEKIIHLFKKEGEISLYLSFIVGIIVLFVLGLIPVLGFVINIFVVLFGVGMLLLGGWNLIKSMKEKKLI